MTCRLEGRFLLPTRGYSLCIPHHNPYFAMQYSQAKLLPGILFIFTSSSLHFQLARNVFHLFLCNFTRICFGFLKKTLWFFPMVSDGNPTYFITDGPKIGWEVIDSKDASLKWIYGNIVDYKVNLKCCTSCIKRLRTVLLNILCWIVTKIIAKCRHKRKKHVRAFQICLLLKGGSPFPYVRLFFKIVFI